jgi:hypothetical protein
MTVTEGRKIGYMGQVFITHGRDEKLKKIAGMTEEKKLPRILTHR